MPGKHAYKKNCFKMKTKTGLYKLDKKKNGNSSAPFDSHCFKKAHEGGALKFLGGMAGPSNPYDNK